MIILSEARALIVESSPFLNVDDYCVHNESAKKLEKIPLTADERAQAEKKFGTNWECSIFKTPDGQYFCTTHRARSKFYPSIDAIPKSVFDFIGSTG